MTKEEAMSLCRYYISNAMESQGAACVSVERKDGIWTVTDCSKARKKKACGMTKKQIQHISDVLDWYDGTDGCEREQPAYEMYVILTDIYNKLINKKPI